MNYTSYVKNFKAVCCIVPCLKPLTRASSDCQDYAHYSSIYVYLNIEHLTFVNFYNLMSEN